MVETVKACENNEGNENNHIDLSELDIPLLVSNIDNEGNTTYTYNTIITEEDGTERVVTIDDLQSYSSVLPIPFGYGGDGSYGHAEINARENGGQMIYSVEWGEGAHTLVYQEHEDKAGFDSTYNECQIAANYIKEIKKKLENGGITDEQISDFYIIASLFKEHGEFSNTDSIHGTGIESRLGNFYQQTKVKFASKSLETAYYKIYTELKQDMYLHLLNTKIVNGHTQGDGTESSTLALEGDDYGKLSVILKEIGITSLEMVRDDNFTKSNGLFEFMLENFNSISRNATLNDFNVQVAYLQYINNKDAVDVLFKSSNTPKKDEVTKYVDASFGKNTKALVLAKLKKLN